MDPQQPPPRYRLVIFDFDGTLADSFPWFVGVFNELADRYRFRRIHEDELDELRVLDGRELVKRLGVARWKLPLIARRMRKLKARDASRISLFHGVDAMLRRLSEAGVTLAIVSSNSHENVRRILGQENAARIAHFECGAALFGKARSLRKVLRQSRVDAREALAVGDEIRDLEAARGAGIPFGAVSWGYAIAESFVKYKPEEMFADVRQIATVIVGG